MEECAGRLPGGVPDEGAVKLGRSVQQAHPASSTIHQRLSVSVFERSMEETVRTLLQNQDPLEGPKVDPLDLMKAYKVQNASTFSRFLVCLRLPEPLTCSSQNL